MCQQEARITAETERVDGRYAVQGHSKPLMLVPIESLYDFLLLNNTLY